MLKQIWNGQIKIIWMFIFIVFAATYPLKAQPKYLVHILSKINQSSLKLQNVTNITNKDTSSLYVLLEEVLTKNFYSNFNGQIYIKGRAVDVNKFESDLRIEWYKVEPLMKHSQKGSDPTVSWFLWYTNAYTPYSPKNRGWIGLDKIEYKQTLLEAENNRWSITADTIPTEKEFYPNDDCGVMRYALNVIYNGKTYNTPNFTSTNHLGIKNNVFKVIVRRDKSYIGYLTSFFNVPGVFGSLPEQVNEYIGVDCADLVVGAYNKWKKANLKFTNVDGLQKYCKSISDYFYIANSGKIYTDKELTKRMKLGFKAGQIIILDYPETKKFCFDHVGVAYKDTGNNILDGEDEILHCGPEELHSSKLCSMVEFELPTGIKLLEW